MERLKGILEDGVPAHLQESNVRTYANEIVKILNEDIGENIFRVFTMDGHVGIWCSGLRIIDFMLGVESYEGMNIIDWCKYKYNSSAEYFAKYKF